MNMRLRNFIYNRIKVQKSFSINKGTDLIVVTKDVKTVTEQTDLLTATAQKVDFNLKGNKLLFEETLITGVAQTWKMKLIC